jgi:hypothetical protein
LKTHLRLGLPSRLFPSGLHNRSLYATLLSPIRATCPDHFILLDLISRIIVKLTDLTRQNHLRLTFERTSRFCKHDERAFGSSYFVCEYFALSVCKRQAGLAESRHAQTSPSNVLQASYRWPNPMWGLESELLTVLVMFTSYVILFKLEKVKTCVCCVFQVSLYLMSIFSQFVCC